MVASKRPALACSSSEHSAGRAATPGPLRVVLEMRRATGPGTVRPPRAGLRRRHAPDPLLLRRSPVRGVREYGAVEPLRRPLLCPTAVARALGHGAAGGACRRRPPAP